MAPVHQCCTDISLELISTCCKVLPSWLRTSRSANAMQSVFCGAAEPFPTTTQMQQVQTHALPYIFPRMQPNAACHLLAMLLVYCMLCAAHPAAAHTLVAVTCRRVLLRC